MTGMSLLELLFVGPLLAGFLLVWTWAWGWNLGVGGLRKLGTAVALRVTDASLSAVESGRVTVTGTARADGERVTAPLSGTDCLAYEVHVMQNDDDGGYLTTEKVSDSVAFDLEDGIERVRVDPSDASLSFPSKTDVTGDPEDDQPDHVRALLEEDAPRFDPDRHPPNFKIDERRLDGGDDVVVHGVASDDGRVRIADAPQRTGIVDRVLADSFFVATTEEVPTSIGGALLAIAIGAALTALPWVAVYNEFVA